MQKVKNKSKKFIKRVREILEIDGSGKYINGYYQLSRRQQFIWVFGLFVIALIFSCKVWQDTEGISGYPVDVKIAAFMTVSIALMLLSAIPVLLPFIVMFLLRKGSLVAFYQVWTMFAIVLIIAYIFNFDASGFFPFLKLPALK